MGDTFDVCGVGSALVDVLVEVTVDWVEGSGLVKGSMQLMDLENAAAIHERVVTSGASSGGISGGIERSGGSAANTIAGLASLGASTGFIGRVAADRFGDVFTADLASLGVRFGGRASATGDTGRCLVLVTPDADRTMCTTLGVAAHLSPADLSEDLIAGSAITYLEGYLWDEPVAIDALRAAVIHAHRGGGRVALSLSDPFCVGRHRAAWRELIASDIDVLFGNEAELCSLTECDDLDAACRAVARPGLTVTVTRGAEGAWTFSDSADGIVSVKAVSLGPVVDTTGAGDLYAAGFLYGLVRGADLETSARYGSIAAGEVISHIGARPEQDLAALLAGA